MSWISFVVVVVILYVTYPGLGKIVEAQFDPFLGGALVLALSLALWGLLWALLVSVQRLRERPSIPDLLRKLQLRDGMLYALYPYLASSATCLATITVILELLRWILLQVGFSLPIIFDSSSVVLSIFTLVASSAYRLEQRLQYAQEVRQSRRAYKQLQKSIVV